MAAQSSAARRPRTLDARFPEHASNGRKLPQGFSGTKIGVDAIPIGALLASSRAASSGLSAAGLRDGNHAACARDLAKPRRLTTRGCNHAAMPRWTRMRPDARRLGRRSCGLFPMTR
jgi:hypothetical protein